MMTALYRLFTLLGRWRPAVRLDQPHREVRSGEGIPALGEPRQKASRRRIAHLHAVRSDTGMTTAEYAVGTVAAVAFAVVLFKVVQSPAVHSALAAVVTGALHVHM